MASAIVNIVAPHLNPLVNVSYNLSTCYLFNMKLETLPVDTSDQVD